MMFTPKNLFNALDFYSSASGNGSSDIQESRVFSLDYWKILKKFIRLSHYR